MEKFIIEGGNRLSGNIIPSGNKNAALPILASVLLTNKEVKIHNLPDIGDIRIMLRLLTEIGAKIEKNSDNSVSICADKITAKLLSPELCKKIRASILFAGPLLARLGEITLNPPGGDVIGRRRVDTHIIALQKLGADFEYDGSYRFKTSRLKGAHIFLDEPSVTATENAIMAAVLAEGKTILENSACEPHIQDLCDFLNKLGTRISGAGTNVITIDGVTELSGAEYTISPDHIEVGSFVGLAATTNSAITIKNCVPAHLKKILLTFERFGIKTEFRGTDLFVPENQKLEINHDLHDMVPKIDDGPWPAFPADLMSIAIVMATQIKGTVLFFEKMFESRMFFVDRLIDMGAKLILCDPHRVVVVGPSILHGSEMASPDIRAGMALLIASLNARGKSVIYNVEQIDRGYEKIEEKIASINGRIKREKI